MSSMSKYAYQPIIDAEWLAQRLQAVGRQDEAEAVAIGAARIAFTSENSAVGRLAVARILTGDFSGGDERTCRECICLEAWGCRVRATR